MPTSETSPKPLAAPSWVQQGLEALCRDLAAALGDTLVSVALYGGLAKGEYGPRSDINVLIVVHEDAPPVLERAGPAIRAAAACMPLAPLFISQAVLQRCTAIFPIKFLNMQCHHVLLWGRDVLPGLTVQQDHLRLRLEQELRNLDLRLRQSYLLHGNRPEQLERILLRGLSSLLNSMFAWVYLASGDRPASKAQVLDAAARLTGLDLTVARTLLHMKYGAPGGVRPDSPALYGEFLSLVRQLAERADRLEV